MTEIPAVPAGAGEQPYAPSSQGETEGRFADAGSQARPPSFEELVLPLLDSSFGLALHLTRNRTDAEDLVQDAVLNAVRGFGTFQTGTNFKAWFFRVIYNCFLSQYRQKAGQRQLVGLEDAAEFYLVRRSLDAGIRVDGADPVGATIGRLQSEQVAEALQSLPDEYRTVAAMYFLEDFSYQEIAGVLGIPVGTVRSRLHRGRKMLQKRLWKLAEDQGIVPRRPAAHTGESK